MVLYLKLTFLSLLLLLLLLLIQTIYFGITEYPPKIIDAGKGLSSETVKKNIEEVSLIIKTTYWYV